MKRTKTQTVGMNIRFIISGVLLASLLVAASSCAKYVPPASETNAANTSGTDAATANEEISASQGLSKETVQTGGNLRVKIEP